jgi:hypothetical protein
MSLKEEFLKCTRGPWVTAGQDVQFRVERYEENGKRIAAVYFAPTESITDLKIDLDFPVKAFGKIRAHRGFLNAYQSARGAIGKEIAKDGYVNTLRIRGYSLGGAYATLFHFDSVVFQNVETITFGAPRVFWLSLKSFRKLITKGLFRVAHRRDPVTMLPPWLFGFRHVGHPVLLGERGIPKPTKHGAYWSCLDGVELPAE